MIDDVLELARTEAGGSTVARQDVPLERLVQALMAAMAPLALERGLRLQGPPVGTLAVRVRVDAALAERALGVLLRQVLRCTPLGAEVRMSALQPQDGPDAGAVVLVVDAADRRRPDAQADLDAEVARRWIGAMGGEVRDFELPPTDAAEAAPAAARPRLWRWQVRLPRAQGAAPPAEPVADPASKAAAVAPAVVLYVEDNAVNLLLVRELLTLRPQLRLVEAEDGASGLAAALAARPGLVLLDMQLPDTDGTTLMRRLRAEPALAGTTYIALSADAMPEHIAAARAAGFDDYWTKPLDFERFLAGIDRWLAQRPPPAR
jgi:CheY-like chemotaxis protein